MYPSRIAGPLSPPTSPRMSGNDRKRNDSIWPASQSQYTSYYASSGKPTTSFGGPYTTSPYQSSEGPQADQLQHGVNTLSQSRPQTKTDSPPRTTSPGHAYRIQGDRTGQPGQTTSRPVSTGHSYEQASRHAQARENSPRQAGHSAEQVEQSDHEEDDEDDDMEHDDDDGQEDTNRPPLTAAEIRQQKRKMKRFRYATYCKLWNDRNAHTHNDAQTHSQPDKIFDE